ncbi:oxidoreductase domain protein [Chthoniobacter flavus Ellin428]|uniref:Oxidoreductase domain protein n=1 Tax=Chthoniobacter flavus Ellin428 TaxID=497964 RepID=B4D8R1_9BACT|nr:Gfo/Idh/MocA family oxidoreductase [Chthoniobacter flavus]EDY17119.1 oxidoreductase domain protein [Chthoniobacter flavus Ellin428]TCO90221.1 glucose-fructose oxidoreductase [Chthoniobacter flavus]
MSKTWKIAGINFDHMHMGDLLRRVHEHPQAEIVGICDEQLGRMQNAIGAFGIPDERVFTDYRACLEKTQPDLVILCPAAAEHGLWTKRVAEYDVNILVEKPFAGSLTEADEMVAVQKAKGKLLAINWPTRWSACSITAKRLIDEGVIGEVLNVHHYGGNRGPLFHRADKVVCEPTPEEKRASWFYKKDRGGGSLLDYAGYGATLGTWFQGGRKPIEVTCTMDTPEGLEVDEHSVTVCRYAHGLSTIQTRWGTFSDPWIQQPQPKCGFVICGRRGTMTCYDYATHLRLQSAERPEGFEVPVDEVRSPFQDPIQYLLSVLEGAPFERGPLHPEIARIGQQIVDSAALSAREKRTVPLLGS